MVMEPEPVYRAWKSVADLRENKGKPPRCIYLTPQGTVLNQTLVEELAMEEELVLLCGHYEGIDERVLEEVVTDYVSIGDYVLTGGELAACVLIDAVSRLCRECSAMRNHPSLSRFRTIFWSIPIIPDRKSGRTDRCRKSF